MKTSMLLAAAAIILTLATASKDHFTPMEQQMVQIATPGLFDNADTVAIDFAQMRIGGYCFPVAGADSVAADSAAMVIGSPAGSTLRAMFDGTVRLCRHHQGAGATIVVRHDNGLETLYEGCQQVHLRIGQRVMAGDTIATAGSPEATGGSRVAMMANGHRLNPYTFINMEEQRLLMQTVRLTDQGNAVLATVTSHDPIELARIEAERREAEQWAWREPFADGNTFDIDLAAIDESQWCYPLPGSRVISKFGRRGGRNHTGVDIKTKANDTIRAAFSGVVTMSQRYYAYGNCITIQHPNGLTTLYSHNSKNMVKPGDKVEAGQAIALTGRTGRATTEHLHFECRIDGVAFNPAKVFDLSSHSLRQEQLTFTRRGGGISIKADHKLLAKAGNN